MTSISSTTLSTMATGTADAAKKAGDTYNQFLTLLTTQLQNQDPLDPMNSSEFTNQLVQFSQVEQGILTNQKLDTLLGQLNNNQMGQSLGYIGKDIYYKGDTVYYDGSGLKIGYAIDGDAKTAKLRVLDANKNVVRTMDITAGNTSGNLTWDGKDDQGLPVADGTYSVVVDALDSTGTQIGTYTGVPARVQGVEMTDGVLYLAVNGDRRIDATTVLSISEPDTIVAPDTGTGTGTTTG
ncbi:MAG: flagellar hook capping family protein [Rhodospirillales bacterium]|nr:flagellar hook capping family protein [Alphaproteobacteria bacterium]MCB9987126.1 flagellar hook capping family protein [Rhodospirillales bacterium]USO08116.1 MAG: flagellar hook capping family protein [Rhodospirillales bacterium]